MQVVLLLLMLGDQNIFALIVVLVPKSCEAISNDMLPSNDKDDNP